MRNSSLGMQFRTCKNFWDFADPKSSLNLKNSYKYKSHTANTRICLESNADSIKSSLRDSTLCVESWQSTFKNTESSRFAESTHKTQQTIEAIAVEVVEFLEDFGCKAGLKSAQRPKSSKSTQDAPKSKLKQDILQKAIARDSKH